jgi:hypothetical protein
MTGILAFALTLTCLPGALLDFAIPIWKNTPEMRIEDAYKWTYQATRGGEHAVPDRETARKWLDNEWMSMGEQPNSKAEWIPLCPEGDIGRVDLRAFKARGGNSDDLLRAFLASSREYRSEPKAFTDAWAELGTRLIKGGFGKVTLKEWQRLDREMKKKGYPAIHHSDDYNKAMRPAYRIITLEQAQLLIPS